MYIDDRYIASPEYGHNIIQYLEEIETALTSKKNQVTFQYGNELTLRLKLPFIGRGAHGTVYEIIDPGCDVKKVIKITHAKLSSLEAALLENKSYCFWKKMSQNSSFHVPEQFSAHNAGLFRIMEKSPGITLTKYLLRLGAIKTNQSGCGGTSYNLNFGQYLYSEQANQIMQAMREIISSFCEYPEFRLSISPNNIHIIFNPSDLSIQRVDLVDIGPVGFSKVSRYSKLNSLERFLELWAGRLKKYISKDIYSYDLEEILYYQNAYKGFQEKWVQMN